MRIVRSLAVAIALTSAIVCFVFACGETRKGPGEECLRGEDCLSGFCTDRVCAAAPTLGTPEGSSLEGDASEASDAAMATDSGASDSASSPSDATAD